VADGDDSRGWLANAERLGAWLENTLLSIVLTAMILLAGGQIGLRNLLGSGFPWADEALRLLVLWVAMLGAVAASRENKHISIDVLSRILPATPRAIASSVVHAFTAFICIVLAWYSLEFVRESYGYEDTLLNDLPAWWFQLILPVGFLLIGYRYCIWTVRALVRLFRPGVES
jgi:TRAP-type C4-dicarboxylate transport system permease small subunit